MSVEQQVEHINAGKTVIEGKLEQVRAFKPQEGEGKWPERFEINEGCKPKKNQIGKKNDKIKYPCYELEKLKKPERTLWRAYESERNEQPADKPVNWVDEKLESRVKYENHSRAKVSFKIRDLKDVQMGSELKMQVSKLQYQKNQHQIKKSIEPMETDPDESDVPSEIKTRKSFAEADEATQEDEEECVNQIEDIRYSETSSYRVVIAVKKAASLLKTANNLLNEDDLKKARLFILEFALTSNNQSPRNIFTDAIKGPLKDLANSDV